MRVGRAADVARNRIRLVALDLDGVCYRGNVVLPGVPEALGNVLARGLDLRYVTNNSTTYREDVAARLVGMGLPADRDRILSSGVVTAHWLRERLSPGAKVLVVGEQGLIRELAEAGLAPVHAGDDDASEQSDAPNTSSHVAAVVVGMDRAFTYGALAAAQAAIMAGALFVATNPDPTFPLPHGLAPGAGSMVAAVATAAGKQPVVMGKPALALAEALAQLAGIPSDATLFIGDRLDTDIEMGERAGMVTALVLTGATTLEQWRRHDAEGAEPRPDHVLDDLGQLPALLDRLGV
jgi:phosphoglycolate/pyridoxal phosphate phosphatase family enzyme